MKECNILDQLTRTQYQTVLSHIRDVILATDIAVHLGQVGRIKAMVDQDYDPMSRNHQYLFMCLLMTSSDLSDQSKDFSNSKAIAENIYKEFFSQGDLEKQMGNSPMEMMDRDRAAVPKIQLDFMDTVAVPIFEMVAELVPEGTSTLEAITMNRRCWAALDEILVEQGNRHVLGLDYLRDDELEKQVLERVQEKKKKQKKLCERVEDGLNNLRSALESHITKEGLAAIANVADTAFTVDLSKVVMRSDLKQETEHVQKNVDEDRESVQRAVCYNFAIGVLVTLLLLSVPGAGCIPSEDDRPINMKVQCESSGSQPTNRDPIGYLFSAISPAVCLILFLVLNKLEFSLPAPAPAPVRPAESAHESAQPLITPPNQPSPPAVMAGAAGVGIPIPAPQRFPMLTSGGCASALPPEVNIGNP
ncbi:unnamed protein product [Cylicocyclus nassatus]|uniref:PDEase domain-containing protein n=1 Tax=Cylicocyclus nassatus TaxID=53992 RepID=A0AA36H8Y1_CYLNA|nr:unnamed protein product [Cylicocyclus nassatus]